MNLPGIYQFYKHEYERKEKKYAEYYIIPSTKKNIKVKERRDRLWLIPM